MFRRDCLEGFVGMIIGSDVKEMRVKWCLLDFLLY